MQYLSSEAAKHLAGQISCHLLNPKVHHDPKWPSMNHPL